MWITCPGVSRALGFRAQGLKARDAKSVQGLGFPKP